MNYFPLTFYAAAHCVKKIPTTWTLKSVRLGEWNTETKKDCSKDDPDYCASPVIDNPIVEQICYKDYRANSKAGHFDIALLRLAKNINQFNNFIRPICLPLDPSLWEKDFTGYTFDVAGKKPNPSTKVKLSLPNCVHISF